jgi:CRISPR-associated protein Cmr3
VPEFRRILPLDPVCLGEDPLLAGSTPADVRMPPWPSVFAGALRTRILVDAGEDPDGYREGRAMPPSVTRVLGSSASEPGSFRITALGLLGPRPAPGGTMPRAAKELVPYFPLPRDLVVLPRDGAAAGSARRGAFQPVPLVPTLRDRALPRVSGSFPLPATPVLCSPTPARPLSGMWITGPALSHWLRGIVPGHFELVPSAALWTRETRNGEAAALQRDLGVSFLVACEGCEELLDREGMLGLGNDSQGACVEDWAPGVGSELPWQVRPTGDRFRIMLATPGIFPGGWRLPGVTREGESWRFSYRGMTAELVAATVGRPGVMSGWDEDRQCPGPAVRAVPQGAVYWLERLSGDLRVLDDLVSKGLGPSIEDELENADARRVARRRSAEGFNQIWVGSWALPAPTV